MIKPSLGTNGSKVRAAMGRRRAGGNHALGTRTSAESLIRAWPYLATVFGIGFLAWAPAALAEEPFAPSETKPAHVLKGGVRGAALLTEDGLQKVGEALKDVKRSCAGLMQETTRKNTVVMRGPNVVGATVLPGMPMATGGIMPFGDMPARRKQVSLFVSQLDRSLALMQNEVAALIIPEDKGQQVVDQWNQVREQMEGVQKNFAELKDLARDPHLDATKIGKRALSIYESMEKVDKSRRQVLKAVRGK